MLFTLIMSIRTTKIITLYLPANVILFVDFKYIPNPTNNRLTIDLDESFGLTSESFLFDLSGKIILQKFIRSGEELDLSEIRQGVYILLLKSDKQVFRTKIEKR